MIGKRIKSLRKENDLLQKELADKLKLSQQTISLYEASKREPDYETLNTIAKFFNVSTDYLLGNSDIRNPYNEDKEEYIVPEEFIDPIKAREYVNKHQIFGFSGFDSDKLDEEEIVRFANELLEQMKMVSYKYKK